MVQIVEYETEPYRIPKKTEEADEGSQKQKRPRCTKRIAVTFRDQKTGRTLQEALGSLPKGSKIQINGKEFTI